MNRRGFLRMLGLAPLAAPAVAMGQVGYTGRIFSSALFGDALIADFGPPGLMYPLNAPSKFPERPIINEVVLWDPRSIDDRMMALDRAGAELQQTLDRWLVECERATIWFYPEDIALIPRETAGCAS